MTTHVGNQIAERFRTLIDRQTSAYDRVFRDRSASRPFKPTGLPAVDIRIGPDDPIDDQVQGFWRSEQQIYVDLYTFYREVDVSEAVFELHTEVDKALTAGQPRLPGVPGVIRIFRGGAEDLVRIDDGEVPLASRRLVYFVLYQHSLIDPSQ